MFPHHQTSSGRSQYLAQVIQPDQAASRIGHDTTHRRNFIRENKNKWYWEMGLDKGDPQVWGYFN